jgi:hypothetical protein
VPSNPTDIAALIEDCLRKGHTVILPSILTQGQTESPGLKGSKTQKSVKKNLQSQSDPKNSLKQPKLTPKEEARQNKRTVDRA